VKNNHFSDVFLVSGRTSGWLICIYTLINLIVLVNALLHSPYVGYDLPEHLKNVTALSQFHLPVRGESREYYSPPLPYVIPALAMLAGANTWWAGKVGQIVNIFLSLATTWVLLRVCDQINPHSPRLKLFSLGLLALMPVYYKTFAQMRGEPYLTFITLLVLSLAIQVFISGDDRFGNLLKLGLALGLAVLVRQWAFFLFPALICAVLLLAPRHKKYWGGLSLVLAISFLVGSWFYFYLNARYGSFLVYGLKPQPAAQIQEKLASLTGLADGKLFSDPVRPSLGNAFIPTMYGDFWGDTHAYFLVSIQNKKSGEYMSGVQLEKWMQKTGSELPRWISTNRYTINTYLGRVNIVSLPASLLLLGGLFYTLPLVYGFIRNPGSPGHQIPGMLSLFTLFLLSGFMLFILRYPISKDGDILKATYLMQVYPLIAIQTAILLEKVQNRWILRSLLVILLLTALFDSGAMFTRYIDIPASILFFLKA
jgi:4-amino-4-deoxy-L-arabinose transferase-like glycosyltransferase